MPSTFLKIENALKRANEFIDVGKRNSALETLCDAIRAKRHRSWQKVHEDIMFKYLELAVELKRSYTAKEGIFQYKLICQQTNIKSFEDVVRRYIDLAEEKAEWAKNRTASSKTDDVDDLDVVQTPEEILLSAVSSEDQQGRSERVKLIPWVRFLWEAYRQCLDILKNNVRTEALYHEIAHRAFQFCVRFNRKTEFRKLCDNLRAHMDYLRKNQPNVQSQPTHTQSHMVNLNNPESLAMQLETRLIQLESATQIELWQEAYRATDDIKRYGLMNLNKKPPKPQLMANYYQKLALVFWKADCHLFHTAALFRLYYLTLELKKTITPEDLQRMASRLVIATLTIPIPPNRADIDKLVDTEENTVETHQRNLASLLGLTTVLPTRAQLIKDLKRMGYLQHAHAPLQDLYNYLEVDFNPLAICQRVQKVIEFIESREDTADIKVYVNALKNIAILRLLKGVSQVYQSIEFKRISELCPFADSVYLETMVVEAARRNDLQVRIDHRSQSLHFGTELCASQAEEVVEGPHLQSMPSEQVRLQLVNTYSTLLRARSMIEPDVIMQARKKFCSETLYRYVVRDEIEHEAILARHNIIEERKRQLEILGVRREQEERLRQEAKQKKIAEEENLRIQMEKENRERLMRDRETKEMKNLVAQRTIVETGMKEDLEQAKKEQKEQCLKQRRLERKIDHLERAKRIEEIPLLEKEYEKWRETDRKIWKECAAQRIADIMAERELAKTLSRRLHKLKDDAESFSSRVNERHRAAFEAKLAAFNEKIEEEKVRRLEARRIKRREERRTQWLMEREKAAEELRRQQEEERRKQREEEERRGEKEELERQNWRNRDTEPSEPPKRVFMPVQNLIQPRLIPPPPDSGIGPVRGLSEGFGRDGPVRVPIRDDPARDGPIRGGPPRDIPARDGPIRGIPPRDIPARDGPIRGIPPRDIPARDGPIRGIPPRDIPARDGPIRGIPPRDAPPPRTAPIRGGPGFGGPGLGRPGLDGPGLDGPGSGGPASGGPGSGGPGSGGPGFGGPGSGGPGFGGPGFGGPGSGGPGFGGPGSGGPGSGGPGSGGPGFGGPGSGGPGFGGPNRVGPSGAFPPPPRPARPNPDEDSDWRRAPAPAGPAPTPQQRAQGLGRTVAPEGSWR